MEMLSGHEGSEALNSGGVQKINPFSFFLSPAFPQDADRSRCQQEVSLHLRE